jgi:activating signal cointegrator 1
MKALSLWQPWASLVALGVKTIETRSWSTSYRGPLAIHAAAVVPDHAFGQCQHHRHWTVGDFTIERDNPRGTARAYLMRGPIAWPYRLPLGAVVATCTLVDVVPMTDHAETGDPECIVVHEDGIEHCIPSHAAPPGPPNIVRLDEPDIPEGAMLIRDVSDQRPYGIYEPGRYAWLLADIKPLAEPIPARGRQGLWNWQEARVTTAVVCGAYYGRDDHGDPLWVCDLHVHHQPPHVERRVSNVTPGTLYPIATWTDDSPDCWRPGGVCQ